MTNDTMTSHTTTSDTTSGTTSGTNTHAATSVSIPVGTRWITHGAMTAPRMPPRPARVLTMPICAGGTSALISRRMTTKKTALTARLTSAAHSMITR